MIETIFIVAYVALLYFMFRGLFDDSNAQGDDKDYWS